MNESCCSVKNIVTRIRIRKNISKYVDTFVTRNNQLIISNFIFTFERKKKIETFLISRKHTRIMTKSMRAKIVNVSEISFKVYYFKNIHALKQENKNGSYSFALKQ